MADVVRDELIILKNKIEDLRVARASTSIASACGKQEDVLGFP